jgi:TonB-linked SusC/RagA family outer membrane protein
MEKSVRNRFRGVLCLPEKHWRKCMRFSIAIFLTILSTSQWLTASSLNGQSLESVQVTIKLKNETLVNLFQKIEQQTSLRFMYRKSDIRHIQNLNVNETHTTLAHLLQNILTPNGLTFQQVENKILVKPAKKVSSDNIEVKPVLLAKSVDNQLKGKVTDDKGEALAGVSILLKETQRGTVTDVNGNYQIEVPEARAVLVFSFVGYIPQELEVGNKTQMDVVLKADVKALDEVVVVGYGTLKKRDLTGAVSQISATKLENENPSSVQDILRANVAGLNVGYSTTAKPGGSLQVRGRKTLNANGDPLIVLDGIIYYGQLADINPNDIQTIDVLKDASSAAVYGAKASSGVILITTKRGKNGKPVITFNANTGLTTRSKNQKLYNAQDFLAFREDVEESMNATHKPYQFSNPNSLPAGISVADWMAYDASSGDPTDVWLNRLNLNQVEIDNYKAGKSIDWTKKVFQTGLQQDYTVSVAGKKDDLTYYMSLGYLDNKGIIVGDRFKTFRTRLNLEDQITPFLKVGINTQFSNRDESYVPVNWSYMVNVSPWGSEFDQNGKLKLNPHDDLIAINPLLENAYTDRFQKYNTLISTIYANVNLPLGISYQLNFSPRLESYRFFNHQSSDSPQWAPTGGAAWRDQSDIYNWQVDNLIKWKKTINNVHDIDITLLANMEKYQSWQSRMETSAFAPNDDLGYHNIATGSNPRVTSNDEYGTADALMARLFYSYKSRYLLTMSMRRDGYSAFGQSNPRATFPSAALGWVFSDESFFKVGWMNYGKLRLSYGLNGNRDIGRYVAISDLSTSRYLHVGSTGVVNQVSTLKVNRMSNKNLQWEKTSSFNLGLDFAFMNNKINGTLEAYNTSSTNLLVQRLLPDVTGFTSVWDNLGHISNKGIELNLSSNNISRPNFAWTSTVNFSLNRNKILGLYGDQADVRDANGQVIGKKEPDDITNKWFIGQPIDVIWDIKVLGVYQESEAETAKKYGVRPGDFKLQDVNDDGKYTDADRQFLGYQDPRFRWTLRNEFKLFKDFDISFLLYSYWGNKGTFNAAKNQNGYMDRVNSFIQPYWTPENPINDYARLSSSNGSASYNVYQDRSFVRMDNISVAYTLPTQATTKLGLKSVKAYFTMRNVAVYARKWKMWDPENNSPTPRIGTLGINISL